jgi:hypothetical protein
VVQVPVVPQAGVSQQGPSALEQSLGVFPQALQQVGVTMTQAEALRQHQQRAQDTLDGKVQLQDYRQALQQRYSELQEGDYRTLAKDTMAEGKRLIAEMGAPLTPQARALFTEDAEQVLSTVQQHALGEYSRRRDQVAGYALSREIQQFQESYARARTPYDRQVMLGQFDDFLERNAATGLYQGTALADVRKKTLDAVAVQEMQTLIQADPDRAERNLRFQTRQASGLAGPDEQGDPGFPTAPPEHLAQLTAQAAQVRRERFAMEEHQERYTAYRHREQQQVNLRPYLSTLYSTLPIPANVPTFQALITKAREDMLRGDIDEGAFEHVASAAQAHASAAAKPPPIEDNDEVERAINVAVRLAETPEQFDQARAFLTQAVQNKALKPETYGNLADKLESRERQNDIRQRASVKAAKDILMRGALVPYGGAFAGQMRPKQQQKLQFALDAFEAQLDVLAQQPGGTRLIDARAREMAWDARIQFMAPDIDDPAEEYLPQEARQATTPHDLAQVLAQLRSRGWADGTLAQILQNWHAWQDYESARQYRYGTPRPGPGTSPAPPGMQPVPRSQQLPPLREGTPGEPRSK